MKKKDLEKRKTIEFTGDLNVELVKDIIDLNNTCRDMRVHEFLLYFINYDPAIRATIMEKYSLSEEKFDEYAALLAKQVAKTFELYYSIAQHMIYNPSDGNYSLDYFIKSKYQYQDMTFRNWREAVAKKECIRQFQYWITGTSLFNDSIIHHYTPDITGTPRAKLYAIFTHATIEKIINNCSVTYSGKLLSETIDDKGRQKDNYFRRQNYFGFDPLESPIDMNEEDADDED